MGDDLLNGIHALVVDDTHDNRIILKVMLENSGAKVTLAENGEEAVNLALKAPFDVILMDIQMVEMDGLEATKKLREAGYKRPIIALTAHTFREERDRCIEAGCDEHLSKPIHRAELIRMICALKPSGPG